MSGRSFLPPVFRVFDQKITSFIEHDMTPRMRRDCLNVYQMSKAAVTKFQFDDKLEQMARELYRDACRSGEAILHSTGGPKAVLADPTRRLEFYRQSHAGFARAQERIIERLLVLENETRTQTDGFLGEELMLRKIADSIAWQMLSSQLYVARLLYAEQVPPRLSQSNCSATLSVARHLMMPDYTKFALLADITTFVQMGDLVVTDASSGQLSFVEVKSGKKNREYFEFLQKFAQSPCVELVGDFCRAEGGHGLAQLERIGKQAAKMEQTSTILKTRKGVDPHLNVNVRIPDKPIEISDYDARLRAVLDNSKEKGWAIDVIDDCLFIGAYRSGIKLPGLVAFRVWFDECSDGKRFPVVNLMQCMEMPLALPVFNRALTEEQMFDLLFGRCKIYLGIQLNKLMGLITELDVSTRWSSRKEAGKVGLGRNVVRVENRVIVCERSGNSQYVGDGFLTRIAFHGMEPKSIAKMIRRMLDYGPIGK